MWPDQVSNSGSLTYESGALPIALCGPADRIPVMEIHVYTNSADPAQTPQDVTSNQALQCLSMQNTVTLKILPETPKTTNVVEKRLYDQNKKIQ